MAIVYEHRRNDNGNVFYIGIGFDKKRANTKKGRNKYWHNIVNKCGYTVNITHKDICKEEACSIEKYLISFWREALGKNNLANITDGGEGMSGVIPNAETREKIAASKRGLVISDEAKAKIAAANKKRIVTKETREKLSLVWKGRVHSEESKRKISLGNIGKKYTQEAKDKISKGNTGKRRTDEVKKLYSEQRKGRLNPNAKKVVDSKNGVIYRCVKDAAIAINISYSHLHNQLTGRKENKTNLVFYK
jgi:hypothetical protein